MKPRVRGKTIFLREVVLDDAELIFNLRTDPVKGKYLSPTSNGVTGQRNFILD